MKVLAWRGSIALMLLLCHAASGAPPAPFVAYTPDPGFVPPPIVLHFDRLTLTGVDWAQVSNPRWHEKTPPIMVGRAAGYLRNGLERMTGADFSIVSQADLSTGIVLVLLDDAPPDIREDSDIRRALRVDLDDPYAANEAFYIRSEPQRVLLVANTTDGLLSAVVELLESVDYEVLGMGPNWTHVPDYRNRPLIFALERVDRPSFYLRLMQAGVSYGAATITSGLTHPADETVDVSMWQWEIGRRMAGESMPRDGGHALQRYHPQVAKHIAATGKARGILAPRLMAGPLNDRPEAAPENDGWLWVVTDTGNNGDAGQRYLSNGQSWRLLRAGQVGWNLDLSVEWVCRIVLEDMIRQAKAWFEDHPNQQFVFGMDPEDGAQGNAFLEARMDSPDWYPRYRRNEGRPLGEPYVLHGLHGLDQPREMWDPAAASDHTYAFASWLLHEFDKWLDSLPPARRVTSTGRSLKDLIRCSFYSYNYHDVPPNFNPDPRIRIQVAGYPKHRGLGKWTRFATHEDIARAVQRMSPNEPVGEYRIYGIALHHDLEARGIPPRRSSSAASIADDYARAYHAGFRYIRIETDLNFGKYGLNHYLISKMLWDASLTGDELDAIRDRWFQRAFGSAWQEMKAYYDYMTPENYPVNGPNTWAQAIRLIDAADQKLSRTKEAAAQRRIDDVKQYWYFHYLTSSGRYATDAPQVRAFLWKGQMSYMASAYAAAMRYFGTRDLSSIVPEHIRKTPAHYDREQTSQWWAQILEHWQPVPVNRFDQFTLADGTPAANVDLNDLVMVEQFQDGAPDAPFYYDSLSVPSLPVFMVARNAGDPLGFTLTWLHRPNAVLYGPRRVSYGVDIWHPAGRVWEEWIDAGTTHQQSELTVNSTGREIHVVRVRLKAPRAGTYRIRVGSGGSAAHLGSPLFEPERHQHADPLGFTFHTEATGYTQEAAYFYIPRGTKSLDLETWDHREGRYIQLHRGLPAEGMSPTRVIDVSAMETHIIELKEGEDGSLASVTGNLFNFPYLYSAPTLWAKSPGALLVPRKIAEADGLTERESNCHDMVIDQDQIFNPCTR